MEHTLELIAKSHAGDKDAREALVEENMGLVYSVARRFGGRGCETEDLLQIGSIGLLKAIDKFDPSFEVRFSTYAVPMIAGEIRRFLRDDGMLKVSRSLKETAARVCAAREELEKASGREPTMEELARRTGAAMEEIVLAMESAAEVESLCKTVYQGDGTAILLGDRIQDQKDRNEELLNRMLLSQLLRLLEPRDQEIIRMRYFQDMTQVQVAKSLGMTQVQVSRAEKRILRRMREAGQ